jgi:predicted PurR-regulated permease PerM
LLLFGGMVGSLLLSIPTAWLEEKLTIRRVLALALVLAGIAAVLAAIAVLRGPALVQQLSTLQQDLPKSAHQIMAQLNAAGWARSLMARVASSAASPDGWAVAISGIRGVMSVTTLTVAGTIIVLFTSIFLAAEPAFYLRGLRRLTPAGHRAMLDRCLVSARTSLQSWLIAKLLSMVIIGVMVALGLWALRVPLPGTLGIIAGLLTFIPNVGPVVSVIPAALLAFAISPTRGLLTLGLFGLVHFVEGNIVTPLAERSIVRLPPALTVAAQLLLASITGALGLAMAAPLTAVALGILQVVTAPEARNRPGVEDLDTLPESNELHSLV